MGLDQLCKIGRVMVFWLDSVRFPFVLPCLLPGYQGGHVRARQGAPAAPRPRRPPGGRPLCGPPRARRQRPHAAACRRRRRVAWDHRAAHPGHGGSRCEGPGTCSGSWCTAMQRLCTPSDAAGSAPCWPCLLALLCRAPFITNCPLSRLPTEGGEVARSLVPAGGQRSPSPDGGTLLVYNRTSRAPDAAAKLQVRPGQRGSGRHGAQDQLGCCLCRLAAGGAGGWPG